MMRKIEGQPQNTIHLNALEQTEVLFSRGVKLEFINLSGGIVWMKWHGDCVAEIDGATSTPLPVGVAYHRERFTMPDVLKLGLIAEEDSVLVLNIL